MFTRKIYDKGAYTQDLYEWTKPQQYLLLPESTHRGPRTCFYERPEMLAAAKTLRISDKNDMVNIESDLYNLNRPNSKNPLAHYPFIKQDYQNPPKYPTCKSQQEDFDINYPKLDGSQWNRGKQIQVQRFESLCLNPQKLSRIRSNNIIGTNTRLYYRDTHIPNIPHTKNQTNTFSENCPNANINSCPNKWIYDDTIASRRDMKYIMNAKNLTNLPTTKNTNTQLYEKNTCTKCTEKK